MRFDAVKKLKGEAFRRLTGVQRSTFEAMAALLFAAKCKQKAAGGKPSTLCIGASRTKKGAGTTSGCSRGRGSGCILKRKPLSTAAIKACRQRTPRRICPKSAAKRIRCPQRLGIWATASGCLDGGHWK